MSGNYHYRAFISYSHADRKSAEWLSKKLHTYRLPSHLAAKNGRNLGRFFLDRDSLAAADDLSDAIKQALAQSETLIVLCYALSYFSHCWSA